MTIQNGLGAEELVRAPRRLAADLRGDVHVRASATTTRTSSTSSTPRPGSGPFAGTATYEQAQEIEALLVASGLHARAFPDLRPAQWSKLIFNATVNTVAALTDLPHVSAFAARRARTTDLGHLVHDLMDEGKAVAAAAGVELHEDPWEMNVAGRAARGETLAAEGHYAHVPSMLEDVRARPADRDRLHHRRARPRGRASTTCPCRCTRRCTGS